MMRVFEKIGDFCLISISDAGKVVLLFLAVLRTLMQGLPDYRSTVKAGYFIGVQSLPVVLTTGAFTGMVLAYESVGQLSRLGVTSWVGPLVANSLVLQLGPVLTGVMLAGRVGGSMAAELGTMAVTEQIDALRTMGVDPVRYLVTPRVVAATLLAPLLTGFSIFLGIIAGFGLAIYGLGVESHYLWVNTQGFLFPYDFFQGLTKAAVFGCVMALVCCGKGMNTRGGAEGVGKSTTAANVETCIAILLLNLFLTMLLSLFV